MVFVARVGGAGELEGDHAAGVGDDQALRGEVREDRGCRGRNHLGLAEQGQGAVDLVEQLGTRQRTTLAEARVAPGVLGRGYPGRALGSQ